METPDYKRPAEHCLDKAKEAVCGPRNETYGPPGEDFACQAAMMSAYLSRTNGRKVFVQARDIPALMIFVKMARQAHAPGSDNWVDTAGYAACGAEVDFNARGECEGTLGIPLPRP